MLKEWSERRDLNSGPLAPHASALPDCATFRTADYTQVSRLVLKVLEGLLQGIELSVHCLVPGGALVRLQLHDVKGCGKYLLLNGGTVARDISGAAV